MVLAAGGETGGFGLLRALAEVLIAAPLQSVKVALPAHLVPANQGGLSERGQVLLHRGRRDVIERVHLRLDQPGVILAAPVVIQERPQAHECPPHLG
jgi:hypothetical protein